VGELSDESTGIQPKGATQSMISTYSRFSQPHISVVLKELERMRFVMLVAENHEFGRYSPKRYALTEAGKEMVRANMRLIEKIDAEVELAWLMGSQK
jgi:DNA-binding PadR family transcriptional regulator